jgi:hypothetical protein
MRTRWLPLLALAAAAAPAHAATVPDTLFGFPGSVRHPSSGASAALALADRWLGEAPFDNPAVAPQRHAEVSPALVRLSRQDLRAANHDYDETPAFLDAAGGWVVAGVGRLAAFAYADQPVLRLESIAYASGRSAGDPGAGPPAAAVRLEGSAREIRAGAGLSWGGETWRVGGAGEWSRRDDRYSVRETSASPLSGLGTVDFSGDAFGFQAGARVSLRGEGAGAIVVGAGVRFQPEMEMSGDSIFAYAYIPRPDGQPGLRADSAAILAVRASGWEGGLSARYSATEQLRVHASFGGTGAREWRGLGATSGGAGAWSAGVEFHDARDPWTVRAGAGQERQSGVPESRAGRLGLGFGWAFGGTTLDVGIVRRTLQRANRPHSYDDRVVATVRTRF